MWEGKQWKWKGEFWNYLDYKIPMTWPKKQKGWEEGGSPNTTEQNRKCYKKYAKLWSWLAVIHIWISHGTILLVRNFIKSNNIIKKEEAEKNMPWATLYSDVQFHTVMKINLVCQEQFKLQTRSIQVLGESLLEERVGGGTQWILLFTRYEAIGTRL